MGGVIEEASRGCRNPRTDGTELESGGGYNLGADSLGVVREILPVTTARAVLQTSNRTPRGASVAKPLPTLQVILRFYGELNDFLSPEQRRKAFAHPLLLSASVKDVIESLGVPHTEVDLILVNSR